MRVLSLLLLCTVVACVPPSGTSTSNNQTGEKGGTTDDNDTGTTTPPIPVDLTPIVAAVASPLTGVAPLQVSFDATTAGGDLGALTGLTLSWSFADGSPSQTGAKLTHTFAAAGTYAVTVTVTDSDGDTAQATVTITVSTEAPATAPTAVAAVVDPCLLSGATGALSATGSTDPDGSALTYAWTIVSAPPNANPLFSDATSATPSLTTDVPGVYEARVTVSDGSSMVASDPVSLTFSSAVAAITLVNANAMNQSAPIYQALPIPFTFLASNSCGEPVPLVSLFVKTKNAENAEDFLTTDAQGMAELTIVSVGSHAGAGAAVVRAGLVASSFPFTVLPGAAAYLMMESPRHAAVGVTGTTVTFRVTDQRGNPAPLDVTFDLSVLDFNVPTSATVGSNFVSFTSLGAGVQALTGLSTTNGVATVQVFSNQTELAGAIVASNLSNGLSFRSRRIIPLGDFESDEGWVTTQSFSIGPAVGTQGAHSGSNTLHATGINFGPVPALASKRLTDPFPRFSHELRYAAWYDLGGLYLDARSNEGKSIGACTAQWAAVHGSTLSLYSESNTYAMMPDCFTDRTNGFHGQQTVWIEEVYSSESTTGASVNFEYNASARGPELLASAPGAGFHVDDVEYVTSYTVGYIKFENTNPVANAEYVVSHSLPGTFAGGPAILTTRIVDAANIPIERAGVQVNFSTPANRLILGTVAGKPLSNVGQTSASALTDANGEVRWVVLDSAATEANTTFGFNFAVQGAGGSSGQTTNISGPPAETGDRCRDTVDNDNDLFFDCRDSDCHSQAQCVGEVCQAPIQVNQANTAYAWRGNLCQYQANSEGIHPNSKRDVVMTLQYVFGGSYYICPFASGSLEMELYKQSGAPCPLQPTDFVLQHNGTGCFVARVDSSPHTVILRTDDADCGDAGFTMQRIPGP